MSKEIAPGGLRHHIYEGSSLVKTPKPLLGKCRKNDYTTKIPGTGFISLIRHCEGAKHPKQSQILRSPRPFGPRDDGQQIASSLLRAPRNDV